MGMTLNEDGRSAHSRLSLPTRNTVCPPDILKERTMGDDTGPGVDVTQNQWQQKEWECYKDPATAAFGACCATCLICKNAGDLGESTPLYALLACCCPVIGIYMLRAKAREVYGIEGEQIMDVAYSCILPTCVNCQVQSEVKRRKGEL